MMFSSAVIVKPFTCKPEVRKPAERERDQFSFDRPLYQVAGVVKLILNALRPSVNSTSTVGSLGRLGV